MATHSRCGVGSLLSSSFCERINSQGKIVLDKSNSSPGRDMVSMLTTLRMNREFARKLEAIKCYGSQFDGTTQAGEVYPNGEPLYDIVTHQAAHYGSLIRVTYGEPFYTDETMQVDDITTLAVSTF